MNRKIRISLSAFIALSIFGLAILVFVHYQTKNTYKVTFTGEEKLGVKISKIHYSGSKEGRVEWELVADSATRSKGSDITVFDSVMVVFYAKDGAPYTLNAKEGRLNESSGEIVASGGVVVQSTEENYRVETESLRYSMKSREVTTEDSVVIASDAFDITGVGLQADVDKGSFTLLKDVKAVFKDTVI